MVSFVEGKIADDLIGPTPTGVPGVEFTGEAALGVPVRLVIGNEALRAPVPLVTGKATLGVPVRVMEGRPCTMDNRDMLGDDLTEPGGSEARSAETTGFFPEAWTIWTLEECAAVLAECRVDVLVGLAVAGRTGATLDANFAFEMVALEDAGFARGFATGFTAGFTPKAAFTATGFVAATGFTTATGFATAAGLETVGFLTESTGFLPRPLDGRGSDLFSASEAARTDVGRAAGAALMYRDATTRPRGLLLAAAFSLSAWAISIPPRQSRSHSANAQRTCHNRRSRRTKIPRNSFFIARSSSGGRRPASDGGGHRRGVLG